MLVNTGPGDIEIWVVDVCIKQGNAVKPLIFGEDLGYRDVKRRLNTEF